MTAPDGKIRIPLNEEGAGDKGQIEEYLRAYNGEGIQHIAFSCDDLYAAWDKLKALGRSEEHTSELESLTRITYVVFCVNKKTTCSTCNTYLTKSQTIPYYTTF